jgi:hypothetical protein
MFSKLSRWLKSRFLTPKSAARSSVPTAANDSDPGLRQETPVLAKCDYFVDIHVWPRQTDPRRWLENFEADERPYAAHLLDAFQYFSTELVDALFVGAFHDLSRHVVDRGASPAAAATQWNDFVQSLIITYPTGEIPGPTDSGYLFARKARQVLGLPDQRILAPEVALAYLNRHGPRPVVFVDDFLGSGSQFLGTWNRLYPVGGAMRSFANEHSTLGLDVTYVPLFATELGSGELARSAGAVRLAPAHHVPKAAGLLDADSFIWPQAERAAGQAVIRQASERAGFVDTGGHDAEDWQGFAKLALAVGFAHGVPDATLPIFHATRPNWQPLVARA